MAGSIDIINHPPVLKKMQSDHSMHDGEFNKNQRVDPSLFLSVKGTPDSPKHTRKNSSMSR